MVGGGSASLVLIGLLGGSVLAAAPPRGDLVETRVSALPHHRVLAVRDTVRNLGRATAPPSTTGYYLGRVRIGGRLVGRLHPGATSLGSATLRIPTSTVPGSYRLQACADDHHQLRESNERNNCRVAAQPVTVPDRTPPAFAGLERATTCIPGAVGGQVRNSSYALRWGPATDDATPATNIVYDIYQAASPGGEDFTAPTYTSHAGATSFTTPLLPDDTTHYFVVRARDRAGNRDTNSVERRGVNLCL
jgi:hypothetical protein